MVRLRNLVPSYCIRDTALDVSTTTWKGTQALAAAWAGWQTPSQWLINWNKGAGGELKAIGAWLISQCTKRLVLGTSSAQANCGLQSPNRCTLRFCAAVQLSIRPVDNVGSIAKTYENLEGNAVR